MNSRRIDLHTHSTASDGSDSPRILIEKAIQSKVGFLALTDHDTMAGISEAFAAAVGYPITFLQGVELSTDYASKEMHLLGYGVERTSSFQHFLDEMVNSRNRRNQKMLDKFRSLGIELTLDEIKAKAGGEEIFSRPHFAQVLVEKGVVQTRQDAFTLYLAEGAACYVPRESISYQDCIQAILHAGGVPVLAHPFLLQPSLTSLKTMIPSLIRAGLQGLEVWHSDHPNDMQQQYASLTEEFNLIPTGGSDYHGKNKPQIELGRGHQNNININDVKIVERLLEQVQTNQNKK